MVLEIASIYGVNVGFEFLPKFLFEDTGDTETKWGLMIDLFCIRLIFSKMA